jgi:hypothetical protein
MSRRSRRSRALCRPSVRHCDGGTDRTTGEWLWRTSAAYGLGQLCFYP